MMVGIIEEMEIRCLLRKFGQFKNKFELQKRVGEIIYRVSEVKNKRDVCLSVRQRMEGDSQSEAKNGTCLIINFPRV